MSVSVDNRVVSMEFDNAKFERNVKESLDTLKHLDKSLDVLSENTKGLNSMSFDKILTQLDNLNNRYTLWGTLTQNVFDRISNKIINMTMQLGAAGQKLKQFSMENLQEGWKKYGDKTSSVQTIMSATGQTLGEVSTELDKLNRFSDQTSYSFVDMTSNIAKFTSQGIALDRSVVQMEGIATWAAKAGQNAQSASQAMYNISQAMGVGYMQLIDWKSIQNANMATKEFKEEAIKAAVEVGSLVQEGDKFVTTEKGIEVTVSNFQETLREGWFNTAAMEAVFTKYGEFGIVVDDLSQSTNLTVIELMKLAEAQENASDTFEGDLAEAAKKAGMSVEDLRKEIAHLNSEELAFSKSAFLMAQQSKSFRDAMNTTRDSVSTAWMNVFETIIGNYEQARVFWTDAASWMSDLFAGPVNSIQEAFKEVMNGPIRSLGFETRKAGIDLSEFGQDTIDVLKSHGLLTEEIEKNSNGISDAMFKITGSSSEFRDAIEEMLKSSDGYSEAQISQLKNLVNYLNKSIGRELLFGTEEGARGAVYNLMDIVDELRSTVSKAFSQIFDIDFKDKIHGILVNFQSLTSGILETLRTSDKIERIFKGIFAAYDIYKQFTRALLGGFMELFGLFKFGEGGFSELITKFFDWIVVLDQAIKKNQIFTGAIGAVVGFIRSLKEALDPFVNSIKQSIQIIINNVTTLFNSFSNSSVGNFLTSFKDYIISGIASGFSSLSDMIKNFSDSFTGAMSENVKNVEDIAKDFGDLSRTISGTFESNVFKLNTSESVDKTKKDFSDLSKIISDFFTNINDKFSLKINDKLKALGSSISKFGESIGKVFDSISFAEVAGVLSLISTVFLLMNLFKAIKSIAYIADSLADVGASIKIFFDNMSSAIKGFTMNMKAEAFLKLSGSIILLAGALIILSFVPWQRLLAGGLALALIMGSLIGLVAVSGKIVKSGGTKGLTRLASVMLAFSAGVLVLVAAFKILEGIPWSEFLSSFGKLILIMSSFIVTVLIISKFAKKGTKMSLSMLMFGLGIITLVKALKKIQEDLAGLNIKDFDKFFVICGVLALMSVAMKGVRAGAGISLLLFVFSVMLIQNLLKKMIYNSISWDQVEEFLKRFEVIFAMMAALSILGRIGGKGSVKAAILMIAFIGMLFVVANLIKIFNTFTGKELFKGIASITILALSFSAILWAAGKLANATKATSTAVIAVVVGISAILLSLIVITNMIETKGKSVGLALGVMAVLLILLGGVLYSLSFLAKKKISINSVWLILASVGLLAGIVIALRVIEGINADKLLTKVISAGALLVGLAGVLAVLGAASKAGIKISVKDAAALIVASLSLVAIGFALKQLNGVDLTGVDTETIGRTLVGLSIALGIVAGLTKLIGAGNVTIGIGLLDLLIGSLGLIFIGLAELASKADGLESGALRIGRAIGGFIGGISAGFKDATSTNFAKMGEDISLLMQRIEPFITGVNGVPNGMENRVATLMGAIKTLSEAKMAATEAEILESKKKVDAFGSLSESMMPLASAINRLSYRTKDVSANKLNSIAYAVSAIAQIMDVMPEEGGISSWFTGEKDLGSFGTNLSSLTTGLGSFITAANGIQDVEGSIEKVSALKSIFDITNEMSKSLQATDGVLSYIIGKKDLGEFGNSLYTFIGGEGSGFTGFISAVNSISDVSGAVTKVADIKSIFDNTNDMAKNVVRSESFIDKIIGKKDLGSFGDSLKNFIGTSDTGFTAFISAVNGISDTASAVTKVADIKSIFDNANAMSKALERDDGIIQTIIGKKDLGSFGKTLCTFIGDDSNGLIAFINKASAIPENAKDISERVKGSTMPMVSVAELLPGLLTNLSELPDPSANVTAGGSFGTAITSYVSSIAGIINSASMLPEDAVEKSTLLEQAVTSAARVIGAMPTTSDISAAPTVEDINSWSTSLKTLLDAMTVDVGTASSETITQVATDALAGIQTSSINVIAAVTSLVDNVVNKLTSSITNARQIGMYVGIGFANGISGQLERVRQAANELGSAATDALAAAAQVQSPSKSGIRIGGFVGLGYAIGLVSKTSEVKAASTELANTALNTVEYASSLINDILESDGTPTIRPVLDLSEVRSEAKAISGLGSTMSFDAAASIAHTRRLNGSLISGSIGANNSTVGPTYNVIIDGIKYNTDDYVDTSIYNFVETMVRKNKMYTGR